MSQEENKNNLKAQDLKDVVGGMDLPYPSHPSYFDNMKLICNKCHAVYSYVDGYTRGSECPKCGGTLKDV